MIQYFFVFIVILFYNFHFLSDVVIFLIKNLQKCHFSQSVSNQHQIFLMMVSFGIIFLRFRNGEILP